MPGRGHWKYKEPFELFDVDLLIGLTKRAPGNILVRGLLWGSSLDVSAYKGLWGILGGYDYVSPRSLLRVSTASLGLGTAGQVAFNRNTFAQLTLTSSFAFGSAGAAPVEGEALDYHRGFGGQGLLELRLIRKDFGMLRLSGREYVIGAGADTAGWEDITYTNASLLVRIFGPLGAGIDGTWSRRTAHDNREGYVHQATTSGLLFLSVLTDARFRLVKPRTDDSE